MKAHCRDCGEVAFVPSTVVLMSGGLILSVRCTCGGILVAA